MQVCVGVCWYVLVCVQVPAGVCVFLCAFVCALHEGEGETERVAHAHGWSCSLWVLSTSRGEPSTGSPSLWRQVYRCLPTGETSGTAMT